MSYGDGQPRSHVSCRGCGTLVAAGARSCAECGMAVPSQMESLPAGSDPTRRPTWLMPAGLVLGALTAVGGGVFLAFALSGPDQVAGGSPAPSLSQQPSAPAPTRTPTPAPSEAEQAPTPVPLPVIPNRAIAVVTEEGDQLHLRTAGNPSANSLGVLSAGARLFVIGAPEASEGYNWYRVSWVDGPLESGCVDACPRIGWVASPAVGQPWLEEADVACGEPTKIEDLAALQPLERLSCFGNRDLSLAGAVEPYGVTGCLPELSPTYRPAWLLGHPCGMGVKFAGITEFMSFVTSPRSSLAEPPAPAGLRFTAHFEDSAAPTCRLVEPGEGIGALRGAELVLHCRTILVVTDYDVIAIP